jgi:hypothetical protein
MADNRLPPSRPKPSWKDPAATGKPVKRSKGKAIFRVASFMLVVVGALVAVLLLLRPAHLPDFLACCITQYDDPRLPVNGQAEQDREALSALPWSRAVNLFAVQEADALKREFASLENKGSNSLVVYLSAHVLTDAKDALYLLPARAELDNPATWLPLAPLLANLQNCPAKHKLLILDTLRPLADPRRGVLSNDVAERLQAATAPLEEHGWLVLCSCSPGQVALTSEDANRSVFGLYVEEGLRGAADGYLPGTKQDNRVSVKELYQYVRDRVDRWAEQNRGTRQTPVLRGDGDDFELQAVSQRGKATEATPEPTKAADAAEPGKAADGAEPAKGDAPPAPPAYPPWLRQGWQVRDRWLANGTWRVAPRTFRILEATLLRAQERWEGGVAAATVTTELGQELARLRDQAEKDWRAIPRPEGPRSLALIAALPVRPDLRAPEPPPQPPKPAAEKGAKPAAAEAPLPSPVDQVEELRAVLLKAEQGRTGKPEDAEKERNLMKEYLKRFKGKSASLDLARAVLLTVIGKEMRCTPERILFLDGLLQEDRQKDPLYVETLVLRRAADLAAEHTKARGAGSAWPAEKAVSLALRAAWYGELAAACAAGEGPQWEPRALPWIRERLGAAAQERHDAEVLLFTPGYAAVEKAVKLFESALGKYDAINRDLDTLARAYGCHDEALARLPVLGVALIHRPEIEPQEEKHWREAVERAQSLRRLLTAPPYEVKRIGDIQQEAEALRELLDRIARPYATGLEELLVDLRQGGGNVRALPRAAAALELPWMSAEQREKLWVATREVTRKLHRQTREADERDDANRKTSNLPQEFAADRAVRDEFARAQRRARVALDLLRLGGVADAAKLEEQAAAVKDNAGLAALAHGVQQACSERLVQQMKDAGVETRELLLRVLDPFDTRLLLRLPEEDRTPNLQLQRRQAEDLWAWYADRCRYEQADLRALGDGAQRFYGDAADEYAALAAPPAAAQVTFPAAGQAPSFRDGKREARVTLWLAVQQAQGAAPAKEVQVEGVSGDESWLQVDPVPPVPVGRPDQTSAQLTLHLPDGAEKGGPPPRGVLVRARVNGRSFHHRLPALLPDPEGKRLTVLVGDTRQPPPYSTSELRLRPGVRQSVYVFVRNPTGQDQDVVVEVRPDKDRTRAVRQAVRLKGGATEPELITFPAPSAPAPGKSAELAELKGPLEIAVLDKSGAPLASPQTLTITYKQPRDYVEVVAAPEFVRAENKLSMRVRPVKGALTGPPCKVQMRVVCKDLLRIGIDDRARVLEADGGPVTLSVGKLEFDDRAASDPTGWVYLDVDKFERALVYPMVFPARGRHTGRELRGPQLRLEAPPFLERDKPCKVVLETLNGDERMQLEILEKRPSDPAFRRKAELPGDRRVRRGWIPGSSDGGLEFELAVEDWPIEQYLDTANLTGEYFVRVRLRQGDQIPLEETRRVVVDNTPPVGRFVRAAGVTVLPKEQRPQPDGPVMVPQFGLVELVAEAHDPEPVTEIKEVNFFLGPPEGNQRPKGEPVRAVAQNGDRYAGKLFIAPAKTEETVSVEIVNGAGMRTFDTIRLVLQPPKPDGPTKKKGPTIIAGRLTVGGLNPQADVDVYLYDEKGEKEVDRTKTRADGSYEFRNVPQGKYLLYAEKADRRARKNISLKEGDQITQDLELSVQGK